MRTIWTLLGRLGVVGSVACFAASGALLACDDGADDESTDTDDDDDDDADAGDDDTDDDSDDDSDAGDTDDDDSDDDDTDDDTDDTDDDDSGDAGSDDVDLSAWIINNVTRSDIFPSADDADEGALYDVQLVETQEVEGETFVYVETTGIPQYDVEITDDILEGLNSRPRAEDVDFADGATTAEVGDIVVFGEDIGYNSNSNCETSGGFGYWPPGPECPEDLGRGEFLAASPTPATEDCESGLGTIGLMVNGAAMFNWGDGMSYGSNVWFNLAPIAEVYDVGICGGHAANGEYHHHHYTQCLADLVEDDGSGHSPIYGYGADGYPVHGPYQDDGELAVSGWVIRDYGADADEGGCGTPGERTCIMVDQFDLSAGVDDTVEAGPDVDEEVSTLSGNTLEAFEGYYLEDYYYAGEEVTGAQLDEHNGHDHGDDLGYHYHITLTEEDGELSPSFPFTIGPTFAGEMPDNAMASCSDGSAPSGPPPGGPPGG